MIAACFLPHPPLLLAEYASAADPGAALRARCRAVLVALTGSHPDRLVVVTGGPRTPDAHNTRPALGLRVAHELLSGLNLPTPATITLPYDAQPDEVAIAAERVRTAAEGSAGVLVMGDGSARRGEKAPGYLDERAAGVDRNIAEALAAGDPGPLAELDPVVAADLMIAGRAAWQVVAAAIPGPPDRATAHAEDPFGVLYHIALWEWNRRA